MMEKTPSPSPTSIVFDPFNIQPNHHEHSSFTNIVRLEESSRIFCPICLESSSFIGIGEIEDDVFDRYIANLLEAIDQNGEIDQLRRIVLTILVIVSRKRTLKIRDDNEFHNFLRILYKLMRSKKFNLEEYAMISDIFSHTFFNITSKEPKPFNPLWKVVNSMLDYSKKEFMKQRDLSISDEGQESYKLIIGSASVIKAYLLIIKQFSLDQVAELIFPLSENLLLTRQDYLESQKSCISFMINYLIPNFWPYYMNLERALEEFERKLVGVLYNAIEECYATSVRLKDDSFSELLIKKDCLMRTHLLIYRNDDANFRDSLRSFLKRFVCHSLEFYLGYDEHVEKFLKSEDIVETNHKNAIALSSSVARHGRTVFYFLINFIAMKQASKYFNRTRIMKVFKCVNPTPFGLQNSIAMMRAYVVTASSIIDKICKVDNVESFLGQTWYKIRNIEDFHQQFCSDREAFFWVHEHPRFEKLTSLDTIKYLLNSRTFGCFSEGDILRLLKSDHYRKLVRKYLECDEGATENLKLIIESKDQDIEIHENFICQVGSTLLAILHNAVLESLNGEVGSSKTKITRLVSMTAIVIAKCRKIHFEFDDRFIEDLFKLIEPLYLDQVSSNISDNLVISMNEFLTILINTNNPCLMKVIKHLNYSILGYMFERLADYKRGDSVSESIARLLLAYESIDYPLNSRIEKNLHPMSQSLVKWTMSQNGDLHILSLIFAKKVLCYEQDRSMRACVTTGLIHMIYLNAGILKDKIISDNFLRIIDISEMKFNPLSDYLSESDIELVGSDIRIALSTQDGHTTPPLSFCSSDESSLFGEEHLSVANILSNLRQDIDISERIPDRLLVSEAVRDQHTNLSNSECWGKAAEDARDALD